MITIISSEDNTAGINELKRLAGPSGEDRPEQGLHPIHQAALAEDWIERLKNGQDVFVFTHSEIAMLRLMRRIGEGVISPDQVHFRVYATEKQEPDFVHVRVGVYDDDDAEFIDRWPCKSGFFKCRGDELFY